MNQSYITLPEQHQNLSGCFIAGYVEGEGCFSVAITKKKGYLHGVQIYPSFNLQVHIRDKPLIEKIKKTLNCGRIYFNSKRKIINYKIYRHQDITQKLIPFFDKYQFHGNKKISFEIFKDILKILDKPGGISTSDLEQIYVLKKAMNHRGDDVE